MEEQKTNSTNILIIFFLSYSFYTIQVLTQQLFYSYSKQSIFIICLFYLLFPLMVFITCKIINNRILKNKIQNNFLYSIISSIYLLLTTIISVINISNIILIYYYPQSSLIILLIFLSLPLIYTIIKGENNFFSLAFILLMIMIIFKYSYLANPSKFDSYTFYNFFKINKDNILPIIITSSPILLEPLLLLNNQKTFSNKINLKFATIAASIISLIGIYTVLRQLSEFGILLDRIRFPYLESIKNIVAGKFFENIDYYYISSLAISIYIKLGYTFISIKKNFNISKILTIILLISTFILIFFIERSMNLYEYLLTKILFITSSTLIISLLLLPFISKRRKKKHA